MKKSVTISIIFILALFFNSCQTKKKEIIRDFEEIVQSGKLTIITLSSSYTYFIYKDEPMGYDYDLCKDFCDYYGLKLEVKVAENSTKLVEMLNNGEGDIVAYPMVVQNALKDSVIYCGPELISHQVLVQRANRGDTILNDVTQLIGKEIYVKHGTKYQQRLINLNEELGEDITIKDIEKDTISVEDLIEMVSVGKIKYTVSDEFIAKLNRTYYRNIDLSLPLSFEQRSSWVVRKDTPELARALNDWVKANNNTHNFQSILKKYFELSKLPFEGEYHIPKDLPKGNISVYDHLFKKYAEGTEFDWYLLASIAYQESRFQPNVTSWAGATGLMGLMPRTAVSLGISIDDRLDPALSIQASVKLLERLNKLYMNIDDKEERIRFILAAYNGGHGHIRDAQALTQKYGGNPKKWAEVEKFAELKSNPEYYNDPVCKNGYFRGTETVNYVSQTMKNWNKFKPQKQETDTNLN